MTFARKMIRWKHDRQWKFDNNMPDFMEGWIDMDQIKWVRNEMPKTDDKQLAVMSLENVAKARAFHESFPQYAAGWFVGYGKASGYFRCIRQGRKLPLRPERI